MNSNNFLEVFKEIKTRASEIFIFGAVTNYFERYKNS